MSGAEPGSLEQAAIEHCPGCAARVIPVRRPDAPGHVLLCDPAPLARAPVPRTDGSAGWGRDAAVTVEVSASGAVRAVSAVSLGVHRCDPARVAAVGEDYPGVVLAVHCPALRCGGGPGELCRSSRGVALDRPHGVRVAQARGPA